MIDQLVSSHKGARASFRRLGVARTSAAIGLETIPGRLKATAKGLAAVRVLLMPQLPLESSDIGFVYPFVQVALPDGVGIAFQYWIRSNLGWRHRADRLGGHVPASLRELT
jgi:hypothetical protein